MDPSQILLVRTSSVSQRNYDKQDTRKFAPRYANPEDLHPQPSKTPRKRDRLTSLTPEQKMERRKIKNRLAAQAARDRKKERTNGLEEAVAQLIVENTTLREEKKALQLRLAGLEERESTREEKHVDVETSSLGSAVSINAHEHITHPIHSSSSIPFLTPEDDQFVLPDIQDQWSSELRGPSKKVGYQRGNHAASSPEDSYALSISPSWQVAVESSSPFMEERCGPLIGHDHILYSPRQNEHLFDPMQIEHDSSSALSFHDHDTELAYSSCRSSRISPLICLSEIKIEDN